MLRSALATQDFQAPTKPTACTSSPPLRASPHAYRTDQMGPMRPAHISLCISVSLSCCACCRPAAAAIPPSYTIPGSCSLLRSRARHAARFQSARLCQSSSRASDDLLPPRQATRRRRQLLLEGVRLGSRAGAFRMSNSSPSSSVTDVYTLKNGACPHISRFLNARDPLFVSNCTQASVS